MLYPCVKLIPIKFMDMSGIYHEISTLVSFNKTYFMLHLSVKFI